jgi:hypothetical protein
MNQTRRLAAILAADVVGVFAADGGGRGTALIVFAPVQIYPENL